MIKPTEEINALKEKILQSVFMKLGHMFEIQKGETYEDLILKDEAVLLCSLYKTAGMSYVVNGVAYSGVLVVKTLEMAKKLLDMCNFEKNISKYEKLGFVGMLAAYWRYDLIFYILENTNYDINKDKKLFSRIMLDYSEQTPNKTDDSQEDIKLNFLKYFIANGFDIKKNLLENAKYVSASRLSYYNIFKFIVNHASNEEAYLLLLESFYYQKEQEVAFILRTFDSLDRSKDVFYDVTLKRDKYAYYTYNTLSTGVVMKCIIRLLKYGFNDKGLLSEIYINSSRNDVRRFISAYQKLTDNEGTMDIDHRKKIIKKWEAYEQLGLT